jgi:hypothetical protein
MSDTEKIADFHALVSAMRHEPERQIRVHLLEDICDFLLNNVEVFYDKIVQRTGVHLRTIIVRKLSALQAQLNLTNQIEMNLRQLIDRTKEAYT